MTVLSAGVSGLVTAYELGKLGYDVRVIEARERVGGLNWSVRKGTEHQEIGATQKQVCNFDEGIDVNVGPWRKLLKAAAPADKDRLVKFLISEGDLDPTSQTDKAIGEDRRQAYDTNQLLKAGIGNRFRSVPRPDGTQAAPIFQPIGGMDQLPQGLARAIGAQKISLGTEVLSVRHDTNGVKLAMMDTKNGKTSELAADFCAVCLPLVGRGRPDRRSSPLFEPAARRVFLSLHGLLLEAGHHPRDVCQRSTMEDRLLIGSAADLPVLRTGLAGRRCRRRLADREDAARESDESLERSEARSQKSEVWLRASGSWKFEF